MALKIKFTRLQMDIVPDGSATAMAYFQVRDDASIGKLSGGVSDSVQFTPTFPATKASLRQNAIAAIKQVYAGAAEEL